MSQLRFVIAFEFLSIAVWAQTFSVAVTVNPSADTAAISPYIYGTNGQSNERGLNITARRLGGNRLTGYNWENNASNMGMDYNQSNANDNYMTWAAGIPAGKENIPGITLTAFHDTSLALGCYSLITIPAAGYVARDKNGTVPAGQAAPSARFRSVVARKGAPLSVSPDTSDGSVYVDEEVNFLVQHFGGAQAPAGVRGYDVDNEPALWPSTHPRIHPAKTTCAEVIAKTVSTARAVKGVDPAAEVFGGVFYGFNEYYSMQDAPDYSAGFSKQGWFVNGFLKALHDSSAAYGARLLDVLDLHWYPDLYTPIVNDNVDSATVTGRLQAPRSLWDSSYVETGWIGQWFSPVSMIRNVQTSIRKAYPGTKLSVSEYDYGAASHVSGGIAQADVLGIFGAYGVYMATHWGGVDGYLGAAYRLYRNYDGLDGTFGDIHVRATNPDPARCSVYASARRGDPSVVDVILINKEMSRSMSAAITMDDFSQWYYSGTSWAFDAAHTSPVLMTVSSGSTGKVFPNITLGPLSAHHLVFHRSTEGVTAPSGVPRGMSLEQNYPNPFNPTTTIAFTVGGADGNGAGRVRLAVYDLLGREVVVLVDSRMQPGRHEVRFDASRLPSGTYAYRLTTDAGSVSRRMVLLK
jgi:hypothetical protein